MAEGSSRALVERLQAANPRNHNLMWQLGIDVSQQLGLPPFHTTGADNPVISIDAAVALIKLFLGKQQPHLFLSINGLMNPPCELWRAEITWPTEAHRARGKSPALALCMPFFGRSTSAKPIGALKRLVLARPRISDTKATILHRKAIDSLTISGPELRQNARRSTLIAAFPVWYPPVCAGNRGRLSAFVAGEWRAAS